MLGLCACRGGSGDPLSHEPPRRVPDFGAFCGECGRAQGAGGRSSRHAHLPRPLPRPRPCAQAVRAPASLLAPSMPCGSGGAAGGVGRRGSCSCMSVRRCCHRFLLAVLLLGPVVAGRARACKRRRLLFLHLPFAAPLPSLRSALRAQEEPGTAVCLPRPPPPPPPPSRFPLHPRAGAESGRRSVRAATRASSGGGAWPCRVGEGNEPQSPGVSAEQRRRRHQVPAELE